MSSEICPVVKVIREIRGAGYSDESDDNVIIVGGSEGLIAVSDNVSFYIMSRKMELARFELTRPTPAACQAKYKSMFRGVVGHDNYHNYVRIIDKVFNRDHMYKQFSRLMELIDDIEELIVAKVGTLARAGKSANVTLPTIALPEHIDSVIMYNPALLCIVVNQIIKYINSMKINSLLKTPVTGQIDPVPKFDAEEPDMKIVIQPVASADAAALGDLLEQEMIVANYVKLVEQYHCLVINHINKVYDVCYKIIGSI